MNEATLDAIQLAKLIDSFYHAEALSQNTNLSTIWQWKYYQQAQDRWLIVPKRIAEWQNTYKSTDWVASTNGVAAESVQRWLGENK